METLHALVNSRGTVSCLCMASPGQDAGANGTLVALSDGSPVQAGWSYDATSGAFVAPYVSPVEVPASVTNYQARATLIANGQFSAVDQAIHASGNQVAIQAWEYANIFNRTDQFVTSFASILGMTEAQVDQLFIAASQVN